MSIKKWAHVWIGVLVIAMLTISLQPVKAEASDIGKAILAVTC